MNRPDTSQFTLRIYLEAPITVVYDAWTIPTQLERWFLRQAAFTMPGDKPRDPGTQVLKGDTYEWLWHGHSDTAMERGVVTEANGSDRFRFVFGQAGIVTVQLKNHKGVTELVLTQEQIPSWERAYRNYYHDCSVGWTFYLANIKSVLEHDRDLRNRNIDYTNVINS